MSLADAFAPAEQHNRELVMHQTWGHLGPARGRHYGSMLIAMSAYDGATIVNDEFPSLKNSPWQYSALHEIVFELLNDADVGVYRATGYLNWRKCKDGSDATELGHWRFNLEKVL